jgi:hypothetical protein
MCKRGAPGRAWKSLGAHQRYCSGHAEYACPFGEIGNCADHHKKSQSDRKRGQHRFFPGDDECDSDRDQRNSKCAKQALGNADEIAAFPRQQRTERHG